MSRSFLAFLTFCLVLVAATGGVVWYVGPTLAGIVVDADGTPVAGARLTLKSAIGAGEYHSYSYRTKTTDVDGGFEFVDLGSYRYTLDVHAAGYESQIRNHEFQSFAERLDFVHWRRFRAAAGQCKGQ